MFFSKNPVRSFQLKVSPGGPDKTAAFGPGSVINGIVNLFLDKPLEVCNVRTVFKCDITDSNSKNTTSNVFSIEAVLEGKPRAEQTTMTLTQGPHQYLFAIKMPQNNYPPTLRHSGIGHRIDYTLQAFLETKAGVQTTATVPVIYLPLIICPSPADSPASVETVTFCRGDSNVQVSAELVKPACLPGDLCTVKLATTTTSNQSDCKISNIKIELVATTTIPSLSTVETAQSGAPILPTDQSRRKRFAMHSETFDGVIQRSTNDGPPSILKFNIPNDCVPTFQSMAGKYINIAYEVVITVTLSGNGGSWFSNQSLTNIISLPITVVTVRHAPYPILVSSQSTNEADMPSFIPSIESPMQSPSSPFLTPGGSVWGSPAVDPERMSVSPSNSHFELEEYEPRQDASGMLMVPGDSASQSRRKSTSSSATAVSDCSVMSSGNQVIVQ